MSCLPHFVRRIVACTFILTVSILPAATPSRAQDEPEFVNIFDIEEAFPTLRFNFPVDLAADGLGSLYVVERAGKIYRFPNDSLTQDTTLFLDIRDQVFDEDLEAGLLSLSFHPDYEENGQFFVYYLTDNPLRSRLSRFLRPENDSLAADPQSEVVILELEQPTPKHNGGDTAFDKDGYLYLSLGDGSTGEDTFDNGQNPKTLLGSLLRIDVDSPGEGRNYGIPPDNPFAGNAQGFREEIYAYGFRNPWRFSIDPETGHIWVGDVGEATWEEVDFIQKGGNYGWPIVEGPSCYRPPENCATDDLIPPVHYYSHEIGRSVTGGFVYRGPSVPELRGKYIFADWGGRQIWSLDYAGQNPYENGEVIVEQITDAERFISSFGVDESGELYMLFTFEGRIMRFKDSEGTSIEPPEETTVRFELDGPNPVNQETSFVLQVEEGGFARVVVYDVLGREVSVPFASRLNPNTLHRSRIDASALPNGLYFVRAETKTGFATKKVVVAR